jgi:PAS domain S-box-containing protein
MIGRAADSTTMRSMLDMIGSDDFARNLLDQIGDSITVTDLRGRILYANQSCARILKRDASELIGESVIDMFTKTEEDRRRQQRIIEETCANGVWSGEVINKDRDGKVHWMECRTFLVRDADGAPTALCGVSRDITDRRDAQQREEQMQLQLLQAQKLESIGTLAGGVAHEVNNPIHCITNFAQILLDREGGNPLVAELAAEIKNEASRVAEIVRSLLQFARAEKAVLKSTRVQDMLHDVAMLIGSLMRHDQIRVQMDIPDDLPEVTCHAQQIQQVLMNLLTNARDALNERYEGFDPDKRITLTAACFVLDGADWVRISVRDEGAGIPAAIRDRIMDPFFTTKTREKGTGLGLSISHGIVKEHGGLMRIDSQEGVYTVFHVELPVRPLSGPIGSG